MCPRVLGNSMPTRSGASHSCSPLWFLWRIWRLLVASTNCIYFYCVLEDNQDEHGHYTLLDGSSLQLQSFRLPWEKICPKRSVSFENLAQVPPTSSDFCKSCLFSCLTLGQGCRAPGLQASLEIIWVFGSACITGSFLF